MILLFVETPHVRDGLVDNMGNGYVSPGNNEPSTILDYFFISF
jgi:hypothetical protein